jgi:hypothetical protein
MITISKSRQRLAFGLLAIFAVSIVIYLLPFSSTSPFDADAFPYALDTQVELESFPLAAQQTPHTCWAATLVMVSDYLGHNTNESELVARLGLADRETGFLPSGFVTYANFALNPVGYSVTLLNPGSQTGILEIITEQLSHGLPVMFYFSTLNRWDETQFDTHYSVIYGIDLAAEAVLVANAYGFRESMSFTELFAALDYDNYQGEPLGHLVGRKVGYIENNNLFVLNRVID